MIIKVDVKPEVFARLVTELPKIGEVARADVSPEYKEWLNHQNNPKLWATKESRVNESGACMPLRTERLQGEICDIATRVVRAPFNSSTKLIQAVIEIPETVCFGRGHFEGSTRPWYAANCSHHPFLMEEFQVPLKTLQRILKLLEIFPE